MPKRSRGTGRPGQRGPIARGPRRLGTGDAASSTRPTDAPARSASTQQRSGSLTSLEEIRAAQLEAQILAQEREAAAAQRRTRDRQRNADVTGVRTRDAAPLAVRATAEYAYVRRDISRIARAAAVMLLVVAILHILINVMGVIRV